MNIDYSQCILFYFIFSPRVQRTTTADTAPSPEIASCFPRDTASCTTPVTYPALARRLHTALHSPLLHISVSFSILSILSISVHSLLFWKIEFPFGQDIAHLFWSKLAEGYEDKRSTSSKPTGDAYTAHPERDLLPGDPNLVGGAPPEAKKTMAEKVKGMFKGHHRDDEEDTDSTVGSGVGHTPEASPYGTAGAGNESSGNAVDPTTPGKEESDVQPQGETGGEALTDHHGNLKPGPHTDSVKRETVFSKIKDKLHGSK